jgi:protein TonB
MRKLIFLALMGIAMFLNSAKAQDNPNKIYDFTAVKKQPEFPGGLSKFYAYLSQEIKYPEVAKKNKTQGKVFASFVVEKDGTLTDLQVIRSLSTETDNEALRVLKKSPKWHPAQQNGTPVRVKYNIAVNFSI